MEHGRGSELRYGMSTAFLSEEPTDVIVIGGGHNGLTCACYLAGAGLGVTVLERNSELGGCLYTLKLEDPPARLEIGGYEHGGLRASGCGASRLVVGHHRQGHAAASEQYDHDQHGNHLGFDGSQQPSTCCTSCGVSCHLGGCRTRPGWWARLGEAWPAGYPWWSCLGASRGAGDARRAALRPGWRSWDPR